ncbi:hypothetical protein ES702_00345 [subsurface metagenome]
MKAKGIIIFLVLMIMVSFIPANLSKAEEQEKELVMSYTSGNDYMEFEEYQKWSYVRGMMDATYTIFSNFVPGMYQKYKKSIEDMNVSQLTKILDKYLEENPEFLHCAAANIFLDALNEIVFKE